MSIPFLNILTHGYIDGIYCTELTKASDKVCKKDLLASKCPNDRDLLEQTNQK